MLKAVVFVSIVLFRLAKSDPNFNISDLDAVPTKNIFENEDDANTTTFTAEIPGAVDPKVAGNCQEVKDALKQAGISVRDCLTAYNGHVYWRIEKLLSWHEARDACRTFVNADLISIHDFKEKALLNNLALNNYFDEGYTWHQKQGCWIGLSRKDNSCMQPMVWSDGTAVDYEDYLQNEPNCQGGDEQCVYSFRMVINHQGVVAGWNDFPCEKRIKSICKMTMAH